jgi:hypothetical protein
MKKLTIIFALLITALFAQTAAAQNDKTIDKETFIKAVKMLEQDPFIKDGKKYREVLTFYLIETKDVSVSVCTTNDATKSFFDKKYKFSNELFSQNMYGMAVYKLENPDKATDEKAAQLAGVESMLRTYEAMAKQNPKAQSAAIDALLAKRADGTLAKYVADNDCSKK